MGSNNFSSSMDSWPLNTEEINQLDWTDHAIDKDASTIHHYPHCQQKPAISWQCWEYSAAPRRSVCVWTSSFGRSTVSLMFPSNKQHLIRMITWACCLTKILNALPSLTVASESQPQPPMFLLCQHGLEARSTDCLVKAMYHQLPSTRVGLHFCLLETMCPLSFGGVSPLKPGLFQTKQWSFDFRIYSYNMLKYYWIVLQIDLWAQADKNIAFWDLSQRSDLILHLERWKFD